MDSSANFSINTISDAAWRDYERQGLAEYRRLITRLTESQETPATDEVAKNFFSCVWAAAVQGVEPAYTLLPRVVRWVKDAVEVSEYLVRLEKMLLLTVPVKDLCQRKVWKQISEVKEKWKKLVFDIDQSVKQPVVQWYFQQDCAVENARLIGYLDKVEAADIWNKSPATHGWTELTTQIVREDVEAVTLLLPTVSKEELNRGDAGGLCAIDYAAFLGHKEIVKLLLERQDLVRVPTKESCAVRQAIFGKDPEILELLLNAGFIDRSATTLAITKCRWDLATRLLIFDGPLVSAAAIEALHCGKYPLDMRRTLVEHAVDPDLMSQADRNRLADRVRGEVANLVKAGAHWQQSKTPFVFVTALLKQSEYLTLLKLYLECGGRVPDEHPVELLLPSAADPSLTLLFLRNQATATPKLLRSATWNQTAARHEIRAHAETTRSVAMHGDIRTLERRQRRAVALAQFIYYESKIAVGADELDVGEDNLPYWLSLFGRLLGSSELETEAILPSSVPKRLRLALQRRRDHTAIVDHVNAGRPVIVATVIKGRDELRLFWGSWLVESEGTKISLTRRWGTLTQQDLAYRLAGTSWSTSSTGVICDDGAFRSVARLQGIVHAFLHLSEDGVVSEDTHIHLDGWKKRGPEPLVQYAKLKFFMTLRLIERYLEIETRPDPKLLERALLTAWERWCKVRGDASGNNLQPDAAWARDGRWMTRLKDLFRRVENTHGITVLPLDGQQVRDPTGRLLIEAVIAKDATWIDERLKLDDELDTTLETGSALYWALATGQDALVAEIDRRRAGRPASALDAQRAAGKSEWKILKALWDRGADLRAPLPGGGSALTLAVQSAPIGDLRAYVARIDRLLPEEIPAASLRVSDVWTRETENLACELMRKGAHGHPADYTRAPVLYLAGRTQSANKEIVRQCVQRDTRSNHGIAFVRLMRRTGTLAHLIHLGGAVQLRANWLPGQRSWSMEGSGVPYWYKRLIGWLSAAEQQGVLSEPAALGLRDALRRATTDRSVPLDTERLSRRHLIGRPVVINLGFAGGGGESGHASALLVFGPWLVWCDTAQGLSMPLQFFVRDPASLANPNALSRKQYELADEKAYLHYHFHEFPKQFGISLDHKGPVEQLLDGQTCVGHQVIGNCCSTAMDALTAAYLIVSEDGAVIEPHALSVEGWKERLSAAKIKVIELRLLKTLDRLERYVGIVNGQQGPIDYKVDIDLATKAIEYAWEQWALGRKADPTQRNQKWSLSGPWAQRLLGLHNLVKPHVIADLPLDLVAGKDRSGILLAAAAVAEDSLWLQERIQLDDGLETGIGPLERPPLLTVIYNGQFAEAKLLLAAGASVRGTAKNGTTTLMAACQVGAHEIAEQLLKDGVRAAGIADDGLSALAIALKAKDQRLVDLLTTHLGSSKPAVRTLEWAAQQSEGELLLELARRGGPLQVLGRSEKSPLQIAFEKNLSQLPDLVSMVTSLVGKEIDAASDYLARHSDHIGFTEQCIRKGARPDSLDSTSENVLYSIRAGRQADAHEVWKAARETGATKAIGFARHRLRLTTLVQLCEGWQASTVKVVGDRGICEKGLSQTYPAYGPRSFSKFLRGTAGGDSITNSFARAFEAGTTESAEAVLDRIKSGLPAAFTVACDGSCIALLIWGENLAIVNLARAKGADRFMQLRRIDPASVTIDAVNCFQRSGFVPKSDVEAQLQRIIVSNTKLDPSAKEHRESLASASKTNWPLRVYERLYLAFHLLSQELKQFDEAQEAYHTLHIRQLLYHARRYINGKDYEPIKEVIEEVLAYATARPIVKASPYWQRRVANLRRLAFGQP